MAKSMTQNIGRMELYGVPALEQEAERRKQSAIERLAALNHTKAQLDEFFAEPIVKQSKLDIMFYGETGQTYENAVYWNVVHQGLCQGLSLEEAKKFAEDNKPSGRIGRGKRKRKIAKVKQRSDESIHAEIDAKKDSSYERLKRYNQEAEQWRNFFNE